MSDNTEPTGAQKHTLACHACTIHPLWLAWEGLNQGFVAQMAEPVLERTCSFTFMQAEGSEEAMWILEAHRQVSAAAAQGKRRPAAGGRARLRAVGSAALPESRPR